MEILGQLVGFIIGFLLLRLAYKLFDKDKITQCIFAVWAAVFILLCSFPWFQGWAKSFIASNITSKLTSLGAQVNTVQQTTTEMHNQLADHQSQIEQHQKELNNIQAKIGQAESTVLNQQSEITNQYLQISMVQNRLNNTQTNIDQQQQKLSNVEYWVQNLYGNMTEESFTATDTNHVFIISSTNGNPKFIFRLNHVPIKNSAEAYAKDPRAFAEQRITLNSFHKNIAVSFMSNFDTTNTSFYIRYVADNRDTNFYQHMPILNQDIFVSPDGYLLK